ncbi:uncharacterized protein LOC5517578 isoform X2 [Nematostella vectensis]|uniref:uncharacterized protein LOC5517578 isoform X2 n=1 Tax=Nematostella vectensis TaxID=45351 RepID=UPI002077266F|nr:uncharacterized protein LOC5517578 isoform X2 [Nematostella vectensis]
MKKTAIYILVAACVTMAFAFPAKTEEDQSCGPCPWHFKCIEGACTPQEKPGPGPNTEDTEELADLSMSLQLKRTSRAVLARGISNASREHVLHKRNQDQDRTLKTRKS